MFDSDSLSPRVLRMDLGRKRDLGGTGPLELAGESWILDGHQAQAPGDLGVAVTELGGAALAQALFRALDPGDDPFILSVGSAVVRGLPTAARTTVSARSPLTGGLAEGQVGSDLGRRLGTVCDALVILGEFAGGDGVLVLDALGHGRVYSCPELASCSSGERNAHLVERFGPGSGLSAGPAAKAGVRHAHLGAGSDPTSFVGRGGLGRALAQHGLLGIFVSAPPVPSQPNARLARALMDSPRLRARSEGGTLELFGVKEDVAVAVSSTTDSSQRHGCRGCPTPCGIVLADSAGPNAGTGAGSLRFSALDPLLTTTGQGLEGAKRVLDVCNALGLDAREAAHDLGQEAPFTGPEEVALALERLVHAGAGPMRPATVAPAPSLLARVGPAASARGADPMRSLTFLSTGNADPQRLMQCAPDIAWPPGIMNPQQIHGQGFLAAWHEDLVAAFDALGFCTFSAAGLLADGAMSLDELARILIPKWEHHPAPGVALREAGAVIARAAHQVLAHWDAPPLAVDDGGDAAFGQLLGEYRQWRGLDGEGRPNLDPSPPTGDSPGAESALSHSATPVSLGRGWVELSCMGLLAEHLGSVCRVQLDLPAPPAKVLEVLALDQPQAAWLLRDAEGRSLPSIWRGGEALAPESLVASGDQLDLVLVVPGG